MGCTPCCVKAQNQASKNRKNVNDSKLLFGDKGERSVEKVTDAADKDKMHDAAKDNSKDELFDKACLSNSAAKQAEQPGSLPAQNDTVKSKIDTKTDKMLN